MKCAGKIIAAKEANLSSSQDSKYWKIPQNNDQSVYETITTSPIGYNDDCEVVCKLIWGQFFETIPSICIDKEFQDMLCSDSLKGHELFWLRCDAIQHHMLIERCRGRYRVFQAYVGSYTAKEWCNLKTLSKRPELVDNTTWKTFSGGRTVGENEIRHLMGSIHQMQSLIPAFTPHLLKYIPGVTKKDIKAISLVQQGNRDDRILRRMQKILGITTQWSAQIAVMVEFLGIRILGVSEHNGKLYYQFGDDTIITVEQGGKKIFQIPIEFYKQVQKINFNISGQVAVSPLVFVQLVNSGILWELMMDPENGGSQGFGYQAATFDIERTFDEGVSKAEELRKMIREAHIS